MHRIANYFVENSPHIPSRRGYYAHGVIMSTDLIFFNKLEGMLYFSIYLRLKSYSLSVSVAWDELMVALGTTSILLLALSFLLLRLLSSSALLILGSFISFLLLS